jgi:hypothetical protein
VGGLDDPAARLELGDQTVRRRDELVDALHRTDVDTRQVLHADARLGDDRQASHGPNSS